MKYVFLIIAALLGVSTAFAELRDPTQPDNVTDAVEDRSQTPYTLTAILISPTRVIAVINGVSVRVGDWIDGAKITSIQSNTVQLEGPDGKITLVLIDPVNKKVW